MHAMGGDGVNDDWDETDDADEEEDAATLDGLDALGSEAACILSALEPRSSRPANSSPTLPSYC